jgi:hypothetical protein
VLSPDHRQHVDILPAVRAWPRVQHHEHRAVYVAVEVLAQQLQQAHLGMDDALASARRTATSCSAHSAFELARRDRREPGQKRKRVKPPGSVAETTIAERGSMR